MKIEKTKIYTQTEIVKNGLLKNMFGQPCYSAQTVGKMLKKAGHSKKLNERRLPAYQVTGEDLIKINLTL